MPQPDQTTDPRIFVHVERMLDGKLIFSQREISLDFWSNAVMPGVFVREVDDALKEVMNYGR